MLGQVNVDVVQKEDGDSGEEEGDGFEFGFGESRREEDLVLGGERHLFALFED